MGLREAISSEGHDLGPQLISHLPDNPVGFLQTLIKALLERRHLGRRALRAHRAPQVIRLSTTESGGIDRNLHELLLKERNPQCLAQGLF